MDFNYDSETISNVSIISAPSAGNLVTFSSNVSINGGTIDNITLGGSTPSPGSFTTLSSTGNLTVNSGQFINTTNGDQARLSLDVSYFREGTQSNVSSGNLYTLLSSVLAMKYWSHNLQIDTSGNYAGRDEADTCILETWGEDDKITYWYAPSAAANVAPSFSQVYQLDMTSGNLMLGPITAPITIETFNSGGAATWINMPTTGPSGIGTGGAGSSAWMAYCNSVGQWFSSGTNAGDLVVRNLAGNVLIGAKTSSPDLIISNGAVSSTSFTSTATTGTAPFIVSSTTLVPNLNVATANVATNLSGGAAGSISYQTASSTSTMLPIGTTNYVLTVIGGLPSWQPAAGGGATITANTSSATFYPTFVSSTSGSMTIADVTTGLTFNPNTNVLTTTTFSGTATNANSILSTSTTSAVAYPVLLSAVTSTGQQSPLFDTDMTYNPSTDILTLPSTGYFSGPHNGTVGATTANTGAFTTLSATGTTTLVALNSGLTTAVALNSTPIGNATPSTGTFTTLTGVATTLGLTSAQAINTTPIGNATPSTGAFTTLTGVATTLGLTSAQAINTTIIGNSTPAAGTFTTLTGVATTLGLTSAQAINNTIIGNSTAAAGTFTTLNATGTTTLVALNSGLTTATALNSTIIGNSSAAAGTFTTINGTGNTSVTGNIVVSTGAFYGSAAGLNSFPTLNQNTTGSANNASYLGGVPAANYLTSGGAGAFTTLSATSTTTLVALNSGLTSAVALNSTPIGNATPSTGAFTTLSGLGTTLGLTTATALNSTIIGNSTPAAGTFTTLTGVATTLGLTSAQAINTTIIGNSTPAAGTFTTLNATSTATLVALNSGLTSAVALNSTPIGNATPSTGAFTTLSATGTTTLVALNSGLTTATALNSTIIGNSAAAAGTFTTLNATGTTTLVALNSGLTTHTALNSTIIGNSTPAAGTFTTLNATSTTTLVALNSGLTSAVALNSTPIGNATPSTGAFTTISAIGALSSSLAMNSTVIGNTTPAAGTFTTLTGVATTLGLTSAQAINSTPIGNSTPSTGVFTTLTGVATTLGLTSAQAINTTIIGNSTPAAGTFTTLTGVATTLGLTSAQAINTTPIGNATPSTGAFTTLTASTPVAIGSGGTGQSSKSAAFNALSPLTTTGDLVYASGTNTAANLAVGSSAQILTVSGGLPSWQNPPTGVNAPVITSTTSGSTFYPVFTSSTSGNLAIADYSLGLSFVPSSNVLTTTGFAGALNGTVGATTPNTGTFTTLTGVATTLGLTSAQAINSTPIGNSTPSTGSFTFVGAGVASSTSANLKVGGGTSTVAPILMTSGTNLSSAVAGAIEYDGTCFYHTPAASTRSVAVTEQIVVMGATTKTLTSNSAAQAIFGATSNGAVTLPTGMFKYECGFSVSSLSGSTGTISFGLGGAATFTFNAESICLKGTSGTAAAANMNYFTSANTIISASNTSTFATAYITGIIFVTGSGTIIPQMSMSQAAASVIGAKSYFRVYPVNSATSGNITVGNWS